MIFGTLVQNNNYLHAFFRWGTHLYAPLCPSFRPSVLPSVCPSPAIAAKPYIQISWFLVWVCNIRTPRGVFIVFWKFWNLDLLWGKKGPKMAQKHKITNNSESALRIFFKLCSKTTYYKRVQLAWLLFPRKCWFRGKWAIWSRFGPKLRSLISQDPLGGFFWNFAVWFGIIRGQKWYVLKFPKSTC